jgi:hypothetical protein
MLDGVESMLERKAASPKESHSDGCTDRTISIA